MMWKLDEIHYFCHPETEIRETMAIITLTSDWGHSDYYSAAVKGVILSQLPNATIVDITHEIAAFNTIDAGFVVKHCFRNFPAGTIHIIAVDTIESADVPHVVVKAEGQYFISADNGVFRQILDDFEEAVEINVMQDSDSFNFPARDRFAKVAVMIAKGVPLSEIGPKRETLRGAEFCAVVRDDSIEGIVIHIDSYGNLITNITKADFYQARRGRDFTIFVKGRLYTINKISDSYLDVTETADLVAIFGSHDNLEIAMREAPIASLCGIEFRSPIRVVFHEKFEPEPPQIGSLF